MRGESLSRGCTSVSVRSPLVSVGLSPRGWPAATRQHMRGARSRATSAARSLTSAGASRASDLHSCRGYRNRTGGVAQLGRGANTPLSRWGRTERAERRGKRAAADSRKRTIPVRRIMDGPASGIGMNGSHRRGHRRCRRHLLRLDDLAERGEGATPQFAHG